jgi:hypothetical protein
MGIITAYNDIVTELTEMQAILEQDFHADVSEAVVDRAKWLEYAMTRTGKLLADAQYHRDKFVNDAMTAVVKEALKTGGWSASTINKKIDALAADHNHVQVWAERLNRSATHAHQFCITLISKQKEEMRMAAFGGGG